MKIEQSEGTVYGHRYYNVRAHGWMRGDNIKWNEVFAWTIETYGPTPEDGVWTPDARWYANNGTFWFRDLEDVTMFVLRWS